MRNPFTRRSFLGTTSALAALQGILPRASATPEENETLAVLGGKPIRRQPFPSWPVVEENDERAWMDVLLKKRWNRLDGKLVQKFEETWAQLLGAKYCLATANGTSALYTSLNALGVGPGDEVLVPPYTFVATINVVLLQHALPVFVDTDRETSQMDARKVEAAITDRTTCILPAHIGGSPADMDTLLEVAKKHKVPVVEDACQAHLSEWRQRKLSTLGQLGCFSFQATKNLNSGEGGAILTNDEGLIAQCRSFHNNGRGDLKGGFLFVRNGCNLRMTEFQGTLLLQQLTRLEEQTRTRERNAQYLTEQLREIPGIKPEKMYEGCTRNAYHIYMMRYDPSGFAGLPRARFLKALAAEGIPASRGYSPLYKEPFLKNTLESRAYKSIYPSERLAQCVDRIHCPETEKLCEEAVWFGQTTFLGPRSDMDQIAGAIRKIQKQAGALAKA